MPDENSIESNESALQLWEQLFAKMAKADNATLDDPTHDKKSDEIRLRIGLAAAGWSEAEIKQRIRIQKEANTSAPSTSPGIAPHVERYFTILCDDIEAAMKRLGLDSQARIARGIEPRVGPLVSMTNVIMTDQAIVTVGSFLFRYCGVVARAFTKTLRLNPWVWEDKDYTDVVARKLLRGAPDLILYWLRIYISYAVTGTQLLVPFSPANKAEVLLFEQVARAMEIFAISHEYGHHHQAHGRQLEADPKREELDADQFALRIGYEVERYPFIHPNPYLSSGAGGVVLLMALGTLARIKEAITGVSIPDSGTHPTIPERLDRFDTVAMLNKEEFLALKGFRTACTRIMGCVEAELVDLLPSLSTEVRNRLREMSLVLEQGY